MTTSNPFDDFLSRFMEDNWTKKYIRDRARQITGEFFVDGSARLADAEQEVSQEVALKVCEKRERLSEYLDQGEANAFGLAMKIVRQEVTPELKKEAVKWTPPTPEMSLYGMVGLRNAVISLTAPCEYEPTVQDWARVCLPWSERFLDLTEAQKRALAGEGSPDAVRKGQKRIRERLEQIPLADLVAFGEWIGVAPRPPGLDRDVDVTHGAVRAIVTPGASGWTEEQLLFVRFALVDGMTWRALGDLYGVCDETQREKFYALRDMAEYYVGVNEAEYAETPDGKWKQGRNVMSRDTAAAITSSQWDG